MKKWRAAKASVLGIVVALMGLGGASTAQAQQVLSTFFNFGGGYWERGSYDGGNNWFGWDRLPNSDGCNSNAFLVLRGPIAAATDQPHSLVLAAIDHRGFIDVAGYDPGSHSWEPWCPLSRAGTFPGGISVNNRSYTWIEGSTPVLSSWGPRRFDLWIVARRDDQALSLLHAWTDDQLPFKGWEELGTGLFSGNPAVVSWAPGRIDVFIRAADHDLAHKWFDGGHWSRGWEDMGAAVTANPTVASEGPGQLDLFVVGGDQALWQRTFNGGWSDWVRVGGVLQPGTSPAAASRGPGFVDVFLYDTNAIPHEFSFTNGVFTLNHPGSLGDSSATFVNAIYWVP
jgi:hypothetical protein